LWAVMVMFRVFFPCTGGKISSCFVQIFR
jgi:hypothetical protein